MKPINSSPARSIVHSEGSGTAGVTSNMRIDGLYVVEVS